MLRSIKDNKFIGLQGLACAAIGIALSLVLDETRYHDVSMAAVLLLAVTLLLICVGQSAIRFAGFWIAVAAITVFHVVLAYYFYPYKNFRPIELFPFLLIEMVLFVAYLNRLDRVDRGASETNARNE